MSKPRLWRTESGVVVRQLGRAHDGKAHFYRHPSGGYHGLLWLNKMTPVSGDGDTMTLNDIDRLCRAHERPCEATTHAGKRCSRRAAFAWETRGGRWLVLCGCHALAWERGEGGPLRRTALADGSPLPVEWLDS